MKKIIIHDFHGESKSIELTEELLNSNPNLNAILERVNESGTNMSDYRDSYERGGGHDKTHDKGDGYSKEHSRRD